MATALTANFPVCAAGGPTYHVGFLVDAPVIAYSSIHNLPSVVPIIPLLGITLPGFASRHAAKWFYISTEELCSQSQLLPLPQVAIILDYRPHASVRAY
jgi:hypothetical protein